MTQLVSLDDFNTIPSAKPGGRRVTLDDFNGKPDYGWPLESAPPAVQKAERLLLGLSHCEVLALDVPPPQLLVANVVECGTLGTIAALPERCKSRLALELAYKVAAGRGQFLGYDILNGGPVGYWWQDDSLANEVDRIRAYNERHGSAGEAPPIRWHLNEGLQLPDDIDALIDDIGRYGQILVVLDSLYNFLPGLDLKDEEVALIYGRLKDVCDATGCTIATIDHMPWPTEGNRGQKRGYGSVFKSAAIRWGIYLEKPGDTLFLSASGNNVAGIKRSVANWNAETLEMEVVAITPKEQTAARIAELREAEPGITQKQVADALEISDRTVRKYWHDAPQESLLEGDE